MIIYVYGVGHCIHMAKDGDRITICGHNANGCAISEQRPGSWPMCSRCLKMSENQTYKYRKALT